jgi:hypothetical protein
LFRLAKHLGRTVEELGEMSHSEVMEWAAFSRIEPIGDSRLDYLFGMLMHTVVACVSSTKHDVTDFIPDWLGERQAKHDPVAMFHAIAGMASKKKG